MKVATASATIVTMIETTRELMRPLAKSFFSEKTAL